jgi:hypothetical protein
LYGIVKIGGGPVIGKEGTTNDLMMGMNVAHL